MRCHIARLIDFSLSSAAVLHGGRGAMLIVLIFKNRCMLFDFRKSKSYNDNCL